MTEPKSTVVTFYEGWEIYQNRLVEAVAPLTDEQLALGAAPHLRSIGALIAHIIGARVSWM